MRQSTDCGLQTGFITSAKRTRERGGGGLRDQVFNETPAVNLQQSGRASGRERESSPVLSSVDAGV